jgi:hypothetical protein
LTLSNKLQKEFNICIWRVVFIDISNLRTY